MLSKTDKDKFLYNTTCMWNLKKPTSQKQRLEWWLPGPGVGRDGAGRGGAVREMERCWSKNTNF